MTSLKAMIHELVEQTHGEEAGRSTEFKARKDKRQADFEEQRAKRKRKQEQARKRRSG